MPTGIGEFVFDLSPKYLASVAAHDREGILHSGRIVNAGRGLWPVYDIGTR